MSIISLLKLSIVILPLLPLRSSLAPILTTIFSPRGSLTSTPTSLSAPSLIFLSLLLVLKYLVRFVGESVGLLTPLRYDAASDTYPLPATTVTAPFTLSARDIKDYLAAVSDHATAGPSKDSDTAPGTNPIFLLTPLTSPLLLLLLANFNHPILPLGAVNVRNRFEFLDVHACTHLASLYAPSSAAPATGAAASVSPENAQLRVTATMGGASLPGRKAKRGVEFDVLVCVTHHGDVIFKLIFTVLQFKRHAKHTAPPTDGKTGGESRPRAGAEQDDRFRGSAGARSGLRLDFGAPDRWAKLSKDYNPIHLADFTARAFGFPGKIVHGNAVVGRVLTGLGDFSARGKDGKQGVEVPRFLEVDFKRPIVVPKKLEVVFGSLGPGETREETAKKAFRVISGGAGHEKVHIDGRFGTL